MSIEKCLNLLSKSLSPIPQELNELDWKSDLSPNHEKLKQHLCAFSNTPGGGYLVFGVDDNGIIVGIDDQKVKNITTTLTNLARDTLEPRINIEFLTFNYKDKPILATFIPENEEKPVYIKNKNIEDSYLRAGGETRKMSREEIKRAILTSRHLRFEELPANIPSENASLEDIFDFSRILERTRPSGFPTKELLYEYLYSLKLLYRANGNYLPTNLCILCCAKDFRKFPGYEKFAIRVTQYSGVDKLSSNRDIFFYNGYTLSLDDTVANIMSILPHNEILKQATFKVVPIIPQIAIREMVANAIIHRDFTRNDSFITIEIFNDRVEITNPGRLLPDINIDRLIDHPSRTRNEILADLMRNLNFCEEKGSGYDKTVTALELYGSPPYFCRVINDYFQVILFTPKDYVDMDKDERIEAVYQHSVLNIVLNKKTNNESIRKRFKFDASESTKVYRLINSAIKAGRIKLANPDAAKKIAAYLPYWQ